MANVDQMAIIIDTLTLLEIKRIKQRKCIKMQDKALKQIRMHNRLIFINLWSQSFSNAKFKQMRILWRFIAFAESAMPILISRYCLPHMVNELNVSCHHLSLFDRFVGTKTMHAILLLSNMNINS